MVAFALAWIPLLPFCFRIISENIWKQIGIIIASNWLPNYFRKIPEGSFACVIADATDVSLEKFQTMAATAVRPCTTEGFQQKFAIRLTTRSQDCCFGSGEMKLIIQLGCIFGGHVYFFSVPHPLCHVCNFHGCALLTSPWCRLALFGFSRSSVCLSIASDASVHLLSGSTH